MGDDEGRAGFLLMLLEASAVLAVVVALALAIVLGTRCMVG